MEENHQWYFEKKCLFKEKVSLSHIDSINSIENFIFKFLELYDGWLLEKIDVYEIMMMNF
jgi:hypothetical protein